jgi:hypothetical protein
VPKPKQSPEELLQMELERRRPEPSADTDKDSSLLLGGLLIEGDTASKGPDLEEINKAVLALRLRRWHNTHGCTRVKFSDPPCRHPDHDRDIALLRGEMMKLDLSGSTDVLLLGYEHEKDHDRD